MGSKERYECVVHCRILFGVIWWPVAPSSRIARRAEGRGSGVWNVLQEPAVRCDLPVVRLDWDRWLYVPRIKSQKCRRKYRETLWCHSFVWVPNILGVVWRNVSERNFYDFGNASASLWTTGSSEMFLTRSETTPSRVERPGKIV